LSTGLNLAELIRGFPNRTEPGSVYAVGSGFDLVHFHFNHFHHFHKKLGLFNPTLSKLSHRKNQQKKKMLGCLLSRGVRCCVESDREERSPIVRDFDTVKKRIVGQHEFVEWCPVVFKLLRNNFDIHCEDYLDSIDQLGEGGMGSGKSGAIFFKTKDQKYLLKQMKECEKVTLMKILYDYMKYTRQYKYTLLPKFLGVYTVLEMTFLVMPNILQFDQNDDSTQTYDLKGSVHNRFTESPVKKDVLKDLNLRSPVVLGDERKYMLMKQLEFDIEWLEQHNLMDYSLLLGVASQTTPPEEEPTELGALLRRNQQKLSQCAALLPENSCVDIQLVGHGNAKRSRESSTVFRQNCTLYTFLVTRKDKKQWIIFRRYKDFERLYHGMQRELQNALSACSLPSLPKKQRIGFMQAGFVRKRENELEQWIQNLLTLVQHRTDSPSLAMFLTTKANRCPPKWTPQDNFKTPIRRRTPSTCEPSATPIKFTFNLLPDAPGSIAIWENIGNRNHQNIHAKLDNQDVKIYTGIIDILQEYNYRKKIESVVKGLTYHADGISAVDPERYGERLLAYVDELVFS